MAKRITKSEAGEAPAKPAAARTRTTRAKATTNGAAATVEATTVAPVLAAELPAPVSTEPTEDDIRFHAYLRYIERGGDHGAAFDDWLEAERALKKGT